MEEIRVGFELLRALKIRERGPELIPVQPAAEPGLICFTLAEKVERHLQTMQTPLKVAVMGCVVNGPGEAREADIGIAGGHGVGIIFKKGEIFRRYRRKNCCAVFLEELKQMEANEKQAHEQRCMTN